MIATQEAQPPARRRARAPRRRRHPRRRARRADQRARTRCVRALARVDLAAIERNCARLRDAAAPARAVRGGQGRRLRPRRGARPRAPRRPAARRGWRWRPPRRRPSCARRGIDGPLLVMGALSGEELGVALAARAPTSSPGARRSRPLAARPARGGPACTSSSTRAWAGSARATPPRRRAWPRAVAAAPGLRLAGAMTHFATADEDDPAFLREQLARLHGLGGRAAREPTRACSARRELGGHAARARRRASDMVRCGIAIYGLDPFQRDPAEQGLEPALELRSYVAEVKPCAPGESAGYGRRFVAEPRRPGWARSRSATATAAPRADQQRRRADRRPPLPAGRARCRWTTSPSTSGPRTTGRARGAAGGPDRATGSSPRSGRRGSGRSTTRSPAGSRARVPREHHRDGVAGASAAAGGRPARRPLGAASERVAGRRRGPRPAARPRRPTTSTSRSRATPTAARPAIAQGGRRRARSRSRDAFGALAGGRARPRAGTSTCVPLREGGIDADLAARDFTVNAMAEPLGRRRDRRPARRPRRPRRAAAADGLARGARATTRCARCGRCGFAVELGLEVEPATRAAVTAQRRRPGRRGARARVRRAQARGGAPRRRATGSR